MVSLLSTAVQQFGPTSPPDPAFSVQRLDALLVDLISRYGAAGPVMMPFLDAVVAADGAGIRYWGWGI